LSGWLDRYRPTVERVCTELSVPFTVCLAQMRTEAGGGGGDLGKRHNHWGVKFPKGQVRFEAMGRPGSYEKMTPERIRIRSLKHIERLRAKGAVFKDTPEVGKSCRLRLRQTFCTWPTLEAGVRGWCAFVTSSRYDDDGVFVDDPARWFAYRWGRGYATARKYVEANVRNLNRLADKTGEEAFRAVIDEGLAAFLDAARELSGKARWAYTKERLEADQLGREVMLIVDEVS
jgi:hypothetical protein